MKIKVNYTAYLVNDWEPIFEKHVFLLKMCGLYEMLDVFNIFAYPKNQKLIDILNKYGILSNKTNVIFQDKNNQEFPAVLDLLDNPYDKNLYFHTKGVSLKENARSYVPSLAWNDYMTYFNIIHFKTCLHMLNETDACGVEIAITDKGVFYCGNFWWANKNFLGNVKKSKNYEILKEMKNRYAPENCFFGVHGKYCELFNSGTFPEKTGSFYFYPFLDYSFDLKRIRIITT